MESGTTMNALNLAEEQRQREMWVLNLPHPVYNKN